MNETPRILVVNLLYMGDLIFSTPFLKNLKLNNPRALIDLVVNENFFDIVADNPYLDKIYPYDKGKGVLYGIRFARRLKSNGYDLGINLHGNERSRLLLKMINPTKIFTFQNKYPDKHMVEAYLGFLEDIGDYPIKDNSLNLEIAKPATEKIIRTDKDEKIVALNVGGSWPTKQWTREGFAQIADELIRAGRKVVFLGSKVDSLRVAEIIKIMGEEPWKVLTGRTNLKELAAVLKQCNVLLSGDTGPLHLASSLAVPVVAIFGPSDDKKYHPYAGRYLMIKAGLPCQPCGLHHCRYHSCMKEIKPAEVLQAITSIIDGEN